jgi:hypothetical protein
MSFEVTDEIAAVCRMDNAIYIFTRRGRVIRLIEDYANRKISFEDLGNCL